ncbi:MAG: lysophospholipase [Thermoleophilaceae bacterium]|nr:lysophospholipase [Thermoleophilaceae bacterium]
MRERALDGHAGSLYVRSWDGLDPGHVVVIAHGYGEHIGRYDHVAEAFVQHGACVHGLDHAGHGRSDGEPALIADFGPVVDDLHILIEDVRGGRPVVLVGHSMGGLVAARYAERHGDGLAGLVLSAPLVGNPGTGALLAMDEIPEVPIDPAVLSRDVETQRAYAEDPLVYHGGFRRPTLAGMAEALLDSALDAHRITGPVLWLHGEDDQLVPMTGSRRFIELLVNAEVTERIYPGARHEVFNETNREEVLADTTGFVANVLGPG